MSIADFLRKKEERERLEREKLKRDDVSETDVSEWLKRSREKEEGITGREIPKPDVAGAGGGERKG